MAKLTRREFIKLSAIAATSVYTQMRLPVFATGKNFTPFKFAFIPDMHLSSCKFDNWILLNESLIIVQETLRLLGNSDVDFILFGGDLIDNEQRDYSDLPTLLDLLYTLEKPYYVILGNREARLNNQLSKEDFTVEFRRYGFADRGITYWQQSPVIGVDLIGLDSSVINESEGEVSPCQQVWLSEMLRRDPNNFKIIALHHPLIPEAPELNFYNAHDFRLNNASALIEILERHQNVDLVLSAHHHLNLITTRNNVHYVNSPSIVTYPCEFRIFEINNNYIEIKNVSINFKQMIKKAEEQLKNSEYARQFKGMKPKDILKLHRGNKSSRDVKLKI